MQLSCSIFARLDAKPLVRKFSKNVFRKLQNALFQLIFQNSLKTYVLIYRAFGGKTQRAGKILRKVWIFFRKLNIKNDFPTISGNVVAKNRALENKIRFLQQFLPNFGGGGVPVFPPPGDREFPMRLNFQHVRNILVLTRRIFSEVSIIFYYRRILKKRIRRK